jgi:hypothetical protein
MSEVMSAFHRTDTVSVVEAGFKPLLTSGIEWQADGCYVTIHAGSDADDVYIHLPGGGTLYLRVGHLDNNSQFKAFPPGVFEAHPEV